MPLSDLAIKAAKPEDKPYKLTDGQGLYLYVTRGSKSWRINYRYLGKQKTLTLGAYPSITLANARAKTLEAKAKLAEGIDPAALKAVQKAARFSAGADTFEAIGHEWYAKKIPSWAPATASKVKRFLSNDLYPVIGKRPINEIRAADLLMVMRRVESRGALELAHRIREYAGQIFRYAVATGRAERDPSGDLRGALPPVKSKHHASITEPRKIGELLRAIEGFTGSFVTKCALQLAPLVFVRPGELRHAEWSEIDFEASEWRISPEKMKMRDKHIVPLSRQSLEILDAIKPLTGHGKYIFPSIRTSKRPMSENTINGALRRLGYDKDEMTGHGFRSMASTLLHEQGWPHEAIERQLAHTERNAVSAAYNYAQHLPKRREMMQHWADYLDAIKTGGKVINISRGANHV